MLRCLEKDPGPSLPGCAELARALAACKDAGSWSPAEAALWWRAHEPSIASEVDLPPSIPGLPRPTARSPSDEAPSLGASEIEMRPGPDPAEETGFSLSIGEAPVRRERS